MEWNKKKFFYIQRIFLSIFNFGSILRKFFVYFKIIIDIFVLNCHIFIFFIEETIYFIKCKLFCFLLAWSWSLRKNKKNAKLINLLKLKFPNCQCLYCMKRKKNLQLIFIFAPFIYGNRKKSIDKFEFSRKIYKMINIRAFKLKSQDI